MDNKQILKADLLDLIFDQRNKDYGAYELRRHYNRRISRSLLITASLVGLTLTSVAVANRWKPEQALTIPKEEIKLTVIDETPPPETPPETTPPPKQEPVRQEIYVPPTIVPDDKASEPMTTQEDLTDAQVSTVKVESNVLSDGTVIGPPSEGEEKGIIEPPKKEPEIYTTVQVEAKFDGNWEKFLTQNLNGDVPVNNNDAPGRYQVMIQFVVDVDGTVSDITPLTNVGYGMEQEAVRVLRKARKWTPAIQAGRQVKAYRRQPITFLVNEE